MTGDETKQFLASLRAAFPTQAAPTQETIRVYAHGLEPIPSQDMAALIDAVLLHCRFSPSVSELRDLASDIATRRIASEQQTRNADIEERFRLASGITPTQELSNRDRLIAMTRDYLHRVNIAKATHNGALPDDWELHEPEPDTRHAAHCPACRGADPRCPFCDGRGVVCPTCGGAHVLSVKQTRSERPLYVGCRDCTDWLRQPEHRWDEHGYPVYERDRFRERDTVHASRNAMRTERAA